MNIKNKLLLSLTLAIACATMPLRGMNTVDNIQQQPYNLSIDALTSDNLLTNVNSNQNSREQLQNNIIPNAIFNCIDDTQFTADIQNFAFASQLDAASACTILQQLLQQVSFPNITQKIFNAVRANNKTIIKKIPEILNTQRSVDKNIVSQVLNQFIENKKSYGIQIISWTIYWKLKNQATSSCNEPVDIGSFQDVSNIYVTGDDNTVATATSNIRGDGNQMTTVQGCEIFNYYGRQGDHDFPGKTELEEKLKEASAINKTLKTNLMTQVKAMQDRLKQRNNTCLKCPYKINGQCDGSSFECKLGTENERLKKLLNKTSN